MQHGGLSVKGSLSLPGDVSIYLIWNSLASCFPSETDKLQMSDSQRRDFVGYHSPRNFVDYYSSLFVPGAQIFLKHKGGQIYFAAGGGFNDES